MNEVIIVGPTIDAVCPGCRQVVTVGTDTAGQRVLVDTGASCLGMARLANGKLGERYWRTDVHVCRGSR